MNFNRFVVTVGETEDQSLLVFPCAGVAAVTCWQLQTMCPSKGDSKYAAANRKGVALSKFLGGRVVLTVPADDLPPAAIHPKRGRRPHNVVCSDRWEAALKKMDAHWDTRPAKAALLRAAKWLRLAPTNADIPLEPFQTCPTLQNQEDKSTNMAEVEVKERKFLPEADVEQVAREFVAANDAVHEAERAWHNLANNVESLNQRVQEGQEKLKEAQEALKVGDGQLKRALEKRRQYKRKLRAVLQMETLSQDRRRLREALR